MPVGVTVTVTIACTVERCLIEESRAGLGINQVDHLKYHVDPCKRCLCRCGRRYSSIRPPPDLLTPVEQSSTGAAQFPVLKKCER